MSYQRRKILQTLARRGATIVRDTGPHTVVAMPHGRHSAVPRHREIERGTARKIARQLGLEIDGFLQEIR